LTAAADPIKRTTWRTAAAAVLLFGPLFVVRGIGAFDFWWWMSADIGLLLCIAAFLDPEWRRALTRDLKHDPLKKAMLGIGSALLLYLFFVLANSIARRLLPFAGSGIDSVYAFKQGASALRIALLMLLVIGPGEELFWRGFLQRRFQHAYGPDRGFLLATAVYTLVHVGSGNLMLVLAAGVCGAYWGLLYRMTGSLLINVISHTLWDLFIFLLFPVST